jgi:hypothetical protein
MTSSYRHSAKIAVLKDPIVSNFIGVLLLSLSRSKVSALTKNIQGRRGD